MAGLAGSHAFAPNESPHVTTTSVTRPAIAARFPYDRAMNTAVATLVTGPSKRPASTAPGDIPLAINTAASGVADDAHR